jgi:transposase
MNDKKYKLVIAVIQDCVNGNISNKTAAKRLSLSIRQVQRLKKKLEESGPKNLIHAGKGKSNHKGKLAKTSNYDNDFILQTYNKPEYKNVNWHHFQILLKRIGVDVPYKSLYNLLISNGYKSPKRHKKQKIHKRRDRRVCQGELLQTDATPFPWFGFANDRSNYNIHGFIDDATGKPTGLYISKTECMHGYLECFRRTLLYFGIPEAIYADGLRVFFNNDKRNLSIEERYGGMDEKKTRFAEILDELGVELIHAHSSQAKGRIERLWDTLQSRLPVEFALANVTNVNEANDFLETYIFDYCDEFAVEPASTKNMFVRLTEEQRKDDYLDSLLCAKFIRRSDRSCTFSLMNVLFKIEGANPPRNKPIDIVLSVRRGIKVYYKGEFYDVSPLSEKGRPIAKGGDSMESIFDRFVQHNMLKHEKFKEK